MTTTSSPLLATHANCLPIGTRVAEFEIVGLIGEGGFGIVYQARDTSLDRIVALKEFMPAIFAGRVDGVRVAVRAANHQATFEAGLKSFINEAKMLAKFAHPALVEVFRFWEGNGTAYMAMRLYRGETLRQVLATGGQTFDEQRIAEVMAPIFDALDMLHREQVFHRDIAPDNIMLAEGRSVLLDFGSARRLIGDATQALTTVLKPGYAPVEQYSDDGSMRQGAWTDVYALGGVLYHLATGKPPLQAVSRILSDPLQTVNQVTGDKFSEAFSEAVKKALNVHVDQRFQTVRAFRDALGWNVTAAQQVVTVPTTQVWLDPDAKKDKADAANLRSETPFEEPQAIPPRAEPVIAGEPSRRTSGGETRQTRAGVYGAAAAITVAAVAAAVWFGRGAAPSGASEPPISAPKAGADALPSAAGVKPSTNATDAPAAATPTPSLVQTPPPQTGDGKVAFDVKPARGRIDINGIAKGTVMALTEVTLPAGKHKIEIINPPAAPVVREIEVVPNKTITVSHRFE
ncbi:MAG: serine/threonine protein kinase [Burkholderiales bacterium]|nr:serine/threonine protein kinase [Burkholderiales bacterium]